MLGGKEKINGDGRYVCRSTVVGSGENFAVDFLLRRNVALLSTIILIFFERKNNCNIRKEDEKDAVGGDRGYGGSKICRT